MPLYHFRCNTCQAETAVKMPFGSTELPMCDTCNTPMIKFIVPPTVHFKGSGFYKTEGRKDPQASEPVKPVTEKKPDAPAATPAPAPAKTTP